MGIMVVRALVLVLATLLAHTMLSLVQSRADDAIKITMILFPR